MDKKPTIITKNVEFETSWFKLVSKTMENMPKDKGLSKYYSIENNDYVSVLAKTPEEKYILVRQYRPATEDYMLELPSGHVEKEQTPMEAAKTELEEETGFTADHFENIGCLASDTGRIANKMWCFWAENAKKISGDHSPEKGVETLFFDINELKKLIVESQFKHALNIAVIFMALAHNKLRI